MNHYIVAGVIFLYFTLLVVISKITSKTANNDSFYTGNRNNAWYIVAFGMIGSSISGVTFISVPGWVGNSNFYYYQMIIGNVIGYFIVASLLLPLYYKLQLTSIYTYLEQRFGLYSYKTGASFFILSRTIGSAFRLFIVARVLQIAFFNHFNIPFSVTVIITIALIWLYTYKGGIKTIVWTDTLQTFFLLAAVIITIIIISKSIDWGNSNMIQTIIQSDYSTMFNWYWHSKYNFFKYVLSGMFITIVMTGLDQDMMQKNLSCRSIGDAKKNMYWYSTSFLFINLLFLGLGALLYMYVQQVGIQNFSDTSTFHFDASKGMFMKTDDLYPMLATSVFGIAVGIVFLVGIIAAAFSSADSALTALTTSFTIDILGIHNKTEEEIKKQRIITHIGFSVLLALIIVAFHIINNDTVIHAIFTVAGYTYGPILGMYAFGLFTKRSIRDKAMPYIAVASPLICYGIALLVDYMYSYTVGYEILILNGAITFAGMYIFAQKNKKQ
jgi:Na+/proline symporter